tara:strand:+ start:853 stop:1482 length:630 start_codon:yes stop_codon:yes gene_type:complete
MAISLNKTAGGAKKSSITSYSYREGNNEVRLVGDVLARYVYWIEGKNGKNIPFECLSFDRNEETFNNKEKDWVKEFYPDLKCGWSYAMQCLDQGQVKVINLKKKLFEAILTAAEDLGDPTDPETGWDVRFEKKKTGPHVYNVEYQLQVLKCKQRALDDDEKAAIADLKSMDDVMPRPTPDAQKKLLDEIRLEAGSAEVEEELASEFDIS